MSQENRATPREKGPVAPTFSALKGGVALQVASWEVSRYKGGVAATLSSVALQWGTWVAPCKSQDDKILAFCIVFSSLAQR